MTTNKQIMQTNIESIAASINALTYEEFFEVLRRLKPSKYCEVKTLAPFLTFDHMICEEA